MTPDVSHIPVMGIWPPYPGMSAHTASARNCESGPTRPSAPNVPRRSKRRSGTGPNVNHRLTCAAVHENVPPRWGPRTGNANRADGSATTSPAGPGLAPTNHTTVESAFVRTAPPIQS